MTGLANHASIVEIAAAFRRGETTPSAYLDHLLDRIADHDARLRSLSLIDVDGARRAASEAERALAAGGRQGPLCGVPIVVKEAIAVRGMPWTAGMLSRKDRVAARDAACVRQLRAAGAIPFAMSSMTEAGFLAYKLHRPPLNPWSLAHWPGTSSSGSGVAVAAGLAPAALGCDTGGSIRFPAAACGLVGLKPSRGAVSLGGVDPTFPYLDTAGPLCHSAADAGLLVAAMARRRLPPPRTGSLRIGLLEQANDAVRDATMILRDLGVLVVVRELPDFAEALQAAMILFAAYNARHWRPSDSFDLLGETLRDQISLGRTFTDAHVDAARRSCDRFTRQMRGLFRDVDLLLTPVFAGGVPQVDDEGGILDFDLRAYLDIMLPVNVAGLPAITLPVGLDRGGLPRAFQLIGPVRSDLHLCQVGDVYQRAAGPIGRPVPPDLLT